MDKDNQPRQHVKNQRRKRKDRESRDFTCKCGKSYLSYAAAYTHVKNKHHGDKEHLDNISKPDRGQPLKRGRPKHKKVFLITHQTQKLSIIQEAILFINEILMKDKEGPNKIILEGNQEQRPDEIVRAYDELKAHIGSPGIQLFFEHSEQENSAQNIIQFTKTLNKHFFPQISIKVLWFMNYLAANFTSLSQNRQKKLVIFYPQLKNLAMDEVVQKLWQDNGEIAQCITESLQKYMDCLKKQVHQKNESAEE